MPVQVRINRATTFVQSREAAAKLVRQVLYEVEFAAKAMTLGGPYSVGNLANSIHSVGPTFTPIGVTGRVGSKLKYAMSVHDGAKRHAIYPKGHKGGARFGGWASHQKPQLKFFWRKAGKIVYFPQIPGSVATVLKSHPGQKGKQYLTEPLRRSARIHHMHIETIDL
jgi:hypothetical protein